MYNEYWKLREQPFQNVPDPRFAYLSDQHREGLARFIYLVANRKLGGVLSGPYGVGKSMIIELLARKISSEGLSRFLCVEILPGETMGLARQLLSFMGQPQSIPDMTAVAEAVRSVCRDPKADFKHTVLAVDEAHLVKDRAVYEFLQMLTNISVLGRDLSAQYPAFTLILTGHIELSGNLEPFESLRQRLQLIWMLEPLSEEQTAEYILHRIKTAGGDSGIMAEQAMRAAHRFSGGLPRIINNLCDLALMLGCAAGVQTIDESLVEQASHEGMTPLRVQAPEGARP